MQTTYWGGRQELEEVLKLAARGLIQAEVSTYSLADGIKAYEALETGKIDGRAVVVPSSQ